ncbi:MAG: hypothetical protein IPK85_20935 [Gemmatimonadetes bacterium]|nr:hypothetical protein [Gemmatimonadota bacterium]
MRKLFGLLWALGGAVAGIVIGAMVALLIAKVTNASNREGAHGYFMVALGLVGGLIGLVTGVVLYARSAPAGQGGSYLSSGALGVLGAIAAVVVATWAFMNLREAPLMYGGALANLELELRVKTASLPATWDANTFDIEVQTSGTRPVATVLWSARRVEGAYTIIPAVQGPAYRAGNRFIVVRLRDLHDEMFRPPMKRTPDPRADWSPWYPPQSVDPPYGVTPPEPPTAILELRYRVRAYGDNS